MDRDGISNLLFLDNTLNVSDKAKYAYMTDAIWLAKEVANPGSDEWLHEIAHRASFNAYGLGNGSLSFLRRLGSISHTLLGAILNIAQAHKVSLYGRGLSELRAVNGPSEARKIIEELIERVIVVEGLIEKVEPYFALMSEMWAIQFTNELRDKSNLASLSKQPTAKHRWWTPPSDSERRYAASKKKEEFHKLLSNLPRDPITFPDEPFRVRVMAAWVLLESFSDSARKQLLTSLPVFYWVDSDDISPIIIPDILHALQDVLRPLWGQALSSSPSHPTRKVSWLADATRGMATYAAQRVEDKILSEDRLKEYKYDLGTTQTLEELIRLQASGGGESSDLTQFMLRYFPQRRQCYNLWHAGRRVDYGLLLFKERGGDQKDCYGDVHVNPIFVSRIGESKGGYNSILEDVGPQWWRRLVALEAIRQALKKGKPLICPFSGWDLYNVWDRSDVRCQKGCLLSYWLTIAGQCCEELRRGGPACDLSGRGLKSWESKLVTEDMGYPSVWDAEARLPQLFKVVDAQTYTLPLGATMSETTLRYRGDVESAAHALTSFFRLKTGWHIRPIEELVGGGKRISFFFLSSKVPEEDFNLGDYDFNLTDYYEKQISTARTMWIYDLDLVIEPDEEDEGFTKVVATL